MVENGKVLTVSFDPVTKRPIYTFSGVWVGHDAKLVSRKLWKAYRLYQANIRREIDGRRATEPAGVGTRKPGRPRKSTK